MATSESKTVVKVVGRGGLLYICNFLWKEDIILSMLLPPNNFFKNYLLERATEGEREGEKHQGVVASHVLPTGDLVLNPGTCPGWESNL